MTPLPLAAKARAWFDEARFVETLTSLARIDSGTQYTPGINEKVGYYERWLEALGFTIILHNVPGYGNNLIAVLKGEGTVSLALIGHIDTVYAVGDAEQYPPRIEGNRLYGLGTSDMHGGNLLMVEVLRFLLERGFKQFGTLLVVLNNDEEVNSPFSRDWYLPLLREYGVNVGLEFEGQQDEPDTGILVSVARRSHQLFELGVTGKAGHSGLGQGASAERELRAKLDKVDAWVDANFGTSLNVTNSQSGVNSPANMTAAYGRATLSLRASTPRQHREIELMLRSLAATPQKVPGTTTTLTVSFQSPPPYQATPEILRLTALGGVVAEEIGLPFDTRMKNGTSDANALVALAGIPTLASLGPVGDGEHNAATECILLGDPLRDKFAFVVGLLARICQEWAS